MVRRGVARFAFAGEAETLDRVARVAPAARAARAAALRVTLHVAVKAIRAAHVCYAVVPGVLRENAQYLRAGRAQCANTLWRLQSLPLPPTSLLWPRQNSRALPGRPCKYYPRGHLDLTSWDFF